MTSKNGCAEFQQLMLKFLGDRDYDSFDFNEIHLLEKKIGYALYGPPQTETGYDIHQNKKIKLLTETILKQNSSISKWKDRLHLSIIFNCTEPLPEKKLKRAEKYKDYDPDHDLNPVPVFVLRKCKNSAHPCRIFIDSEGRVYQSWLQYITKNQLKKCIMVLPADGLYRQDCEGRVLLERHPSPACRQGGKILQKRDIASAIGGVASGGVFVAAAIPAISVAPAVLAAAAVAGVGVGAYSIGRRVYPLIGRSLGGPNASFANCKLRGAYENIVAGIEEFVGAAIEQETSTAKKFGNSSNASSSDDSLDQSKWDKEKPSGLTLLRLSSSILFFTHSVCNFETDDEKSAEIQLKFLKNFPEILQKNAQRRIIIEKLKESIAENYEKVSPNEIRVIKSVVHLGKTTDQVFVVLNHWNQIFDDKKIRFSMNKGQILLNNRVVDISEFGTMNQIRPITYLEKSSGILGRKVVTSMVKYVFKQAMLSHVLDCEILASELLKIVGNGEFVICRKMVIALAGTISNPFITNTRDYMRVLDNIYPCRFVKYFKLIRMISGYFQKIVNKVERNYQKWCETQDPSFKKPYFVFLSEDSIERAVEIFNIVTKFYFTENGLTRGGMTQLAAYFCSWFTEQVYLYQEKQLRRKERMKHSDYKSASKIKCLECNGMRYESVQ